MMKATVDMATVLDPATAFAVPDASQADPEPERELVWTIDLDGRPLQVVTEWWKHRPASGKARQDPQTGEWVGQRIYCPTTGRTFFPAS